jgi:hypothetical protein
VPRLSDADAPEVKLRILLLGDTKTGKTHWAGQAAEAGFNVLYLGGDVELPTLVKLSPAAKERLYYMPIHSDMIQIVADVVTGRYLWNDAKAKKFSALKDGTDESGAALDPIWELKPTLLDRKWVMVIDSWSTLSYSAMLAKAGEMGVDLADIEKVERSIYSGVGNRLTAILNTLEKAGCHIIVIGHGRQMEKTKAPDGGKQTVKEVREIDRVIEWTKMIPQSSSNPHGLSMGKFFTDIGWLQFNAGNKRKLSFKPVHDRVSGGHLNTEGDPDTDHSFAALIKFLGGTIPDGTQGTGEGLTIHPAGTYVPIAPGKAPALQAPKSPTAAIPASPKGLGGLLKK